MARLPNPGGDENAWGTILNEFLNIEHNSDGTLKKAAAITQAQNDAATALSTAQSAQNDAATALSTAQSAQTAATSSDATTQRVEVAKAGTLVSTRKQINFIDGANVTVTTADNSANNRVDVTIAAAGGGGSSLETTTAPPSTSASGSALGTSVTAAHSDHTHAIGTHTHANAANGGQLLQANTHGSPDTDTATTALHHTLGTGANQAAAGNHTHTSLARGLCIYDGSAYPTRPSGYAAVEFVGPVDPDALAQDNDTWINTA